MLGFFHAFCAEQNLYGAFICPEPSLYVEPSAYQRCNPIPESKPLCHAPVSLWVPNLWVPPWAAWAGLAAALSGGWGLLWSGTLGKAQPAPGEEGSWDAAGKSWVCTVTSPSFMASGHFPHCHNLVQGWAGGALPAGLGDSSGCLWLLMMTTISPPRYFWLSVLLWMEGPGSVKDVSSHIV